MATAGTGVARRGTLTELMWIVAMGQLTRILRRRQVEQPPEGFPQYTMTTRIKEARRTAS
jgi:hypothetical protein